MSKIDKFKSMVQRIRHICSNLFGCSKEKNEEHRYVFHASDRLTESRRYGFTEGRCESICLFYVIWGLITNTGTVRVSHWERRKEQR